MGAPKASRNFSFKKVSLPLSGTSALYVDVGVSKSVPVTLPFALTEPAHTPVLAALHVVALATPAPLTPAVEHPLALAAGQAEPCRETHSLLSLEGTMAAVLDKDHEKGDNEREAEVDTCP